MSPTSFSSRRSDSVWSSQQFDPCSHFRSTRTATSRQGITREGSALNQSLDLFQGAASPPRTRFFIHHRRHPGTNLSTTTTRPRDTAHIHPHFNSSNNKTIDIILNNSLQPTLDQVSAVATHDHRQESPFRSDDDPATEITEAALVEGSIQNQILLRWMA